MKELSREGFYNGLSFHRVQKGFVAETGDPTGTGSGGSGTKLKPRFLKIFRSRSRRYETRD